MHSAHPDMLVPLLSLRDVADVLGVSVDTARRLVRRGDLGSVRVGRMLRIHPADVRAYVEERWTPRRA